MLLDMNPFLIKNHISLRKTEGFYFQRGVNKDMWLAWGIWGMMKIQNIKASHIY